MYYLNPRVDIAFKKLFGSEHHKNLTMQFLNNILNLPEQAFIKEIAFRETERLPEILGDKKIYFDIYCTDQRDHNYIIEMQIINEFNFIPRSEHYVARALANQLPSGGEYQKLLPVIFLGIVNYPLFDGEKEIISQYRLTNVKTGKILDKSLVNYYYVELFHFTKSIDELSSIADKWLYFLKHAEDFEVVPGQLKDLQEAFAVLDKLKWSKADLQYYIKQEESIGREIRQQAGAHLEGKQEGLQEGIVIGAQEVAINLLQEGFDIHLVVKTTKLSLEQVEVLANQLKK